MSAPHFEAPRDDDGFDKSYQLEFAKGRVFRVGSNGRTAADTNRARAEYYRRWQARMHSMQSASFYVGRR